MCYCAGVRGVQGKPLDGACERHGKCPYIDILHKGTHLFLYIYWHAQASINTSMLYICAHSLSILFCLQGILQRLLPMSVHGMKLWWTVKRPVTWTTPHHTPSHTDNLCTAETDLFNVPNCRQEPTQMYHSSNVWTHLDAALVSG